MYVPSLTSTTNGVFSYVYNQITGEDASVVSGYWNAFPNGMWVTALPTNNYEPLEVPRRDMTEKVGVSFLLLLFLIFNKFSSIGLCKCGKYFFELQQQ